MRALPLLLAAVETTPVPSSGTAELITVTCAGIAAILVALGGLAGIRRRRADPTGGDDPDDRTSRLRERITTLETRVQAHDDVHCADRLSRLEQEVSGLHDDLDDQSELLTLLRAQGIIAESTTPRPRRRPPRKQP